MKFSQPSGKLRYQLDQLLNFFRLPVFHQPVADVLACDGHFVGHVLTFWRHDHHAHAPVFCVGLTPDQPQIVELCHLSTYGCVVSSDAICQIDNAYRTKALNMHQKREEGSVERNSGGTNDFLVDVRSVHYSDNVEQSAVHIVNLSEFRCILHVFLDSLDVPASMCAKYI